MSEVVINKHINDNPDSIEIGSPSKGGCMKVYGDASNKEEFKEKIKNMAELRQFAQTQV